MLLLVDVARRADATALYRSGAPRPGYIKEVDRRAKPAGELRGWLQSDGGLRRPVRRQKESPQLASRMQSPGPHQDNRLLRTGDYRLRHASEAASDRAGVSVRRHDYETNVLVSCGREYRLCRPAGFNPKTRLAEAVQPYLTDCLGYVILVRSLCQDVKNLDFRSELKREGAGRGKAL